MGRGDRRSRRGKIWRGTTGVRRPKNVKKGEENIQVVQPAAKKPSKKS